MSMTSQSIPTRFSEVLETRWWWVRHAPVRVNEGRIYGQADLDCDCNDSAVFKGLARSLPDSSVWVTSTLKRAHQTALAIVAVNPQEEASLSRSKFNEEAAFSEQNLGCWQGLTRQQILEHRGRARHSVWLGAADERPEGGESFEDLVKRVKAAISRLTERHRGHDIIAVAHAGTIRAALSVALNLPPEAALAFAIDNCSVTRLDHLGEPALGSVWRVSSVNHRPWEEHGRDSLEAASESRPGGMEDRL